MSKLEQPYRALAKLHFDELYQNGVFSVSADVSRITGKPLSSAKRFMRWFKDHVEDFKPAENNPTWEDPRSQTIFTDLGPDHGGVFLISKDDLDRLRRDYSKYWGGGAMSQADIAINYKFQSVHAFEVFKRVHGLRQSSLPYDDSALLALGPEEAAAKTIASHRQEYLLKLQGQERMAEKRDAEKWRALEHSVLSITSTLQPLQLSDLGVEALLSPPVYPYALVISLTDLHLGKSAYDVQGRQNYNRAEAARRAIESVRDLLKQALVMGRPDEIMLILGSDGLDADGPLMTTTSGTSLAGQTDGTYREMVEDYLNLCQQVIGLCRTLARTKALILEGNHDRVSSMMIGLMLEQLYRGDSRVEIQRQLGDGVIFFNYEENSLMFTHGDFLRSFKDVFRIMLGAASERGLPLKNVRLSFSGHLHHEKTEDLGGIKHHLLPALCSADEYHRRHHYSQSTTETVAFVLRRSGGKSAVFYSDPAILSARTG